METEYEKALRELRGYAASTAGPPEWIWHTGLPPTGGGQAPIGGTVKNPPPAPPLIETFADHELIMEMLARGYAVAKMPAEDLAEGIGG